MALRELWISFRLVPVVGLPVMGGMVVIALPAELVGASAIGGAGYWYAVAASASICVAAALAASTIADERRRGAVAWMAVRAVPRSAVLLSWFVAYGLLLAGGIFLGSIGAWLAALGRAETPLDPLPFVATVAAVGCTALVSLAAGLVIGTILGRWPAAILAVLFCAALLATALLGPLAGIPLPTGGIALLADLGGGARPVGDALRSAGTALATAAGLLVVAAAVLERADL
jgi:hypothetical protein